MRGANLQGLVLTGGLDNICGAIACMGASPTIKNCLIVGNRSVDTNGATVYCQDSSVVFENCTIAGNHAGESGAALHKPLEGKGSGFDRCDSLSTWYSRVASGGGAIDGESV